MHKIRLKINYRFPVENLPGQAGISSDEEDPVVSNATFYFQDWRLGEMESEVRIRRKADAFDES